MTVRINRVYTRFGDRGETSLVGGSKVRKHHPRVIAYGEVDELNSVLGIVLVHLSPQTKPLAPIIESLQQELFDLGSELATPAGVEYPEMWHVGKNDVTRLEGYCDKYLEGLDELRSFILPGGSVVASYFHLARTVCRRAERSTCALAENEAVNTEIISYLNRFSDLLFILGRWALKQEGKSAPLWIPAKDRAKATR